ncbi:hypothetical protein BsWGS_20189 [Bradybaena similaris]
MMSAHSYVPISKARSRSPSPSAGRSQLREQNQTVSHARDLFDVFPESASENLNDNKTDNCRTVGLSDSQPIDAIVTISRNHSTPLEEPSQPLQSNLSRKRPREAANTKSC